MKILIFSPEEPYSGAESLVVGKLMRAFLNQGWDVTMIFHKLNLLNQPADDILNILNNCHGIENRNLNKLKKYLERTPLLRIVIIFDYLLWVLKSFILSLKLDRKDCPFDLVLSRIMPSYGHLPAYLLTRIRNIIWFANWSDPLPHVKAPHPYGKGIEALANGFEMLYMRIIVKGAHFHTFPCSRLMNYYSRYLPGLSSKGFVIPHIILDYISDMAIPTNNEREFTITHVGSFGLRSPLNLIMTVKKIVATKIDFNIRFRFVGGIEEIIRVKISENELYEYFNIDGKKSYKDALEIIAESDMTLVIEAQTEEGIFLPSKVMDYLQFNKPILSISPLKGVMNDLNKWLCLNP